MQYSPSGEMRLEHFGLVLYSDLLRDILWSGWLLQELLVEDAERFSADMIRRSSLRGGNNFGGSRRAHF